MSRNLPLHRKLLAQNVGKNWRLEKHLNIAVSRTILKNLDNTPQNFSSSPAQIVFFFGSRGSPVLANVWQQKNLFTWTVAQRWRLRPGHQRGAAPPLQLRQEELLLVGGAAREHHRTREDGPQPGRVRLQRAGEGPATDAQRVPSRGGRQQRLCTSGQGRGRQTTPSACWQSTGAKNSASWPSGFAYFQPTFDIKLPSENPKNHL